LRETLYRATRLEFLRTLSGTEGAWGVANRYSLAKMSHAMYLADGPDQAMLESTRQFHSTFGANAIIPAFAVFPVYVDLVKVLDLTDPEIQDILGSSLEELTGDWRAALEERQNHPRRRVVTHDLGRAAFEAGWEALKYPSAPHPRRWNVVVFTEHALVQPRPQLPKTVQDAVELLQGVDPSGTSGLI